MITLDCQLAVIGRAMGGYCGSSEKRLYSSETIGVGNLYQPGGITEKYRVHVTEDNLSWYRASMVVMAVKPNFQVCITSAKWSDSTISVAAGINRRNGKIVPAGLNSGAGGLILLPGGERAAAMLALRCNGRTRKVGSCSNPGTGSEVPEKYLNAITASGSGWPMFTFS